MNSLGFEELGIEPQGAQGYPLSQIETIPSAVTEKLATLWIVDAGQLIAITGVRGGRSRLVEFLGIRREQVDSIINEAKKVVPSDLINALQKSPATTGRGLGGLKPTQEMLEQISPLPQLLPKELASLPPSVNLSGEMPPIRNQGSRNACVPFAFTALHEYWRQTQYNPQDFSEQHLYFECKQHDGEVDNSGTYMESAVTVLAGRGQCREYIWPYNSIGHGQMPLDAPTDGASFTLTIPALNSNNVDRIKAALHSRSVVAFMIPVYRSWYNSADTDRTGRITMPIGNETYFGYHAMCFIGYQDDTTAPGGGYFVLRNSWGVDWGRQCAYGAGNGTIPYQYIAEHAFGTYVSPNANERFRERPAFDLAAYRSYYPDLQAAFGADDNAYRRHWLEYGINEGRRSSPAFDVRYYLEAYPDLMNAFGPGNFRAALTHYIEYGLAEGRRSAPDFSVQAYVTRYRDLQAAFGQNWAAAANHWIEYGVNEGRVGGPFERGVLERPAFDLAAYRSYYPDLQAAFGADDMAYRRHWLEYGINEGRRSSPAFDVRYYLEAYPDLVNAFGSGNFRAALTHYIEYGLAEGRQSAPDFSVQAYVIRYPDLQAAFGQNWAAAANHWIEYGVSEGRIGGP